MLAQLGIGGKRPKLLLIPIKFSWFIKNIFLAGAQSQRMRVIAYQRVKCRFELVGIQACGKILICHTGMFTSSV